MNLFIFICFRTFDLSVNVDDTTIKILEESHPIMECSLFLLVCANVKPSTITKPTVCLIYVEAILQNNMLIETSERFLDFFRIFKTYLNLFRLIQTCLDVFKLSRTYLPYLDLLRTIQSYSEVLRLI